MRVRIRKLTIFFTVESMSIAPVLLCFTDVLRRLKALPFRGMKRLCEALVLTAPTLALLPRAVGFFLLLTWHTFQILPWKTDDVVAPILRYSPHRVFYRRSTEKCFFIKAEEVS